MKAVIPNSPSKIDTSISGVYKTYYLISDDATAMTDAADHRIEDATGFKAFRITPVALAAPQNLAYTWSTSIGVYAALETKLTTVLGQLTTATGVAQEDARVVAQVGDGTASEMYETQPWINYDGTTTIKSITTQNAGTAQIIMVEVLV